MFPDFLHLDADLVAKRLLGCLLERTIDGQRIVVKIVETESYDQADAASHSHKGRTLRNDIMFGPSGHLYVYFTYGMHYCCNVVTGKRGEGSAVLIRAIEPIKGRETMQLYRNTFGFELTNGPAKTCQALNIDHRLNGHSLRKNPLRLLIGDPYDDENIIVTTRIGISKAMDAKRRYYIRNNPYVSKS